MATSSPSRTTREPPIRTSSSGAVRISVLPRSVRMNEMPGLVGHGGDELGRLVGVGGVQHRRAVHGTERGDVLERHLRRAVLADRDAGVRAGQADVRPRDRRHADEVVGAREERGERRGERHPAAHLHADRRGDHLLLGDEHLEVAVLVRLAEQLGVRRVRHLAVERDDVAAHRAERGQRLAVGLARRLLLADLVRRQLAAGRVEGVRRPALRRGERAPRGRAGRRAPRSPRPGRRAACRACRAGPRPP